MSEFRFVVCPILIPVFVRCLSPIGQTPDRESDKQRLPFRTEAGTEGGRAGLPCIQYEETCARGAKSEGRNAMKSGARDQAEGTLHELKGRAREIAGKVTGNPTLQAKGAGEKIAGKVQVKIGQVKKVLGK